MPCRRGLTPPGLPATVYVETLDRSFESVCELDLIFNSPKARDTRAPPLCSAGGALTRSTPRFAPTVAHPPPPRPRRLEKATDTLGSGIGTSVAQNKFRR